MTVSKDISNPEGHNQGAARSPCTRHIGSFVPVRHQAASGGSPISALWGRCCGTCRHTARPVLLRKKKRTEEARVAAGCVKNPTSIISLDSPNCILRYLRWFPFYEIRGSGKLGSAESHTTCKQPNWHLDLDQLEFMTFQGLVLLGLVCSRRSISVLSLVHSRCSVSVLSNRAGGVRAAQAGEGDVNGWFLVRGGGCGLSHEEKDTAVLGKTGEGETAKPPPQPGGRFLEQGTQLEKVAVFFYPRPPHPPSQAATFVCVVVTWEWRWCLDPRPLPSPERGVTQAQQSPWGAHCPTAHVCLSFQRWCKN